ncbi:MAG: universal stress protein [Bacteroidales bacterium]|nr:universal stress protein [Bacteroidales bacterium]
MKAQLKSILIPTDFSDLSESALRVGIAIARRQNSSITLLHVVDMFTYLEPAELFLPDFRSTPDLVLTMKDRLEELSSKIQKDTGIPITGIVLDGQPADRICRYAYEENVNLIVMGTHGTSGLREFFIGSEAFRVVKNTTCPVLTIPGNWKKTEFEKVLFPIRITTGAIDKYFYSRPIIEKNNSELILLGLTEKKRPGDLKKLTILMDELKIRLHNDNVEFHTVLSACEDFPEKVIEVAKDYKTDLIVLTANLDYNFKAYFVGPYSQQIINHSRLPVLSVKPSVLQTDKNQPLELAGAWGKKINYAGL